MLSPNQIENRLRKHYDVYWGERAADEWWGGNIPDNVWKFDRRGKTIILTCNPETGKVTEEVKELRNSGGW